MLLVSPGNRGLCWPRSAPAILQAGHGGYSYARWHGTCGGSRKVVAFGRREAGAAPATAPGDARAAPGVPREGGSRRQRMQEGGGAAAADEGSPAGEGCGPVRLDLPLCAPGGPLGLSGEAATAIAAATAAAAALVASLAVQRRRRRSAALQARRGVPCRDGCPPQALHVHDSSWEADLFPLLDSRPSGGGSATGGGPSQPGSGAAAAAAWSSDLASWRLQSSSLRLRPQDFTISVGDDGQPQLLGSGAFSRVSTWAVAGWVGGEGEGAGGRGASVGVTSRGSEAG
jgi:hypothetical protein